MARVFIGLGSNLAGSAGPPESLLRKGCAALRAVGDGWQLSPLYRSDAWPDPAGPPYLNAVAVGYVTYPPEAIMAALLAIEAAFGRVRCDDPALRYSPRTLDLDLLDCGGAVMTSPTVTLPHPGMLHRKFVLAPLLDLCPDWCHPITGESGKAAMAKLGEQATMRWSGP